jgi:hypothetical protein
MSRVKVAGPSAEFFVGSVAGLQEAIPPIHQFITVFNSPIWILRFPYEYELRCSCAAVHSGAACAHRFRFPALPATGHILQSAIAKAIGSALETATECPPYKSEYFCLPHIESTIVLTPLTTVLPCIVPLACHRRPLQIPRCRQECLGGRYQKGLLRSSEEVSPRYQQGPRC